MSEHYNDRAWFDEVGGDKASYVSSTTRIYVSKLPDGAGFTWIVQRNRALGSAPPTGA
jgi:hypothetical protein